MSITLNNRARKLPKKAGKHFYYDWEVFIDEDDEILDSIDHVVYTLHETFPNPIRTIADRTNKFALRSRGWGEFILNAEIVFKDSHREKVKYRLRLSKPWE